MNDHRDLVMQRIAGRPRAVGILALLLIVVATIYGCGGGSHELILATTTSTQDSGLLDVLIPQFEKEHDYKVKTVAVGSGEALRLAGEGEADVVLAHSPKAEEDFMAAGNGESRLVVMHNDFIIVGPGDDPAGIKGLTSAADAFKKIASAEAIFLSRGDQSGTNTKELSLWTSAGIQPSGAWYQETGSGMGATLNVATQKRGYTLSDRGTYLAQKKNLDLDLLVEGDKALFNQYHVMVVDPKKHSNVNAEGARAFASWITSVEVQKTIGDFGVKEYGQQLFIPDAGKEAAGATPTSAARP
ncbi:MAG: tungsten ABC transporter substrate-binding protein [Chloroflexi bacterium]|nr:MAG: tungsten ABC transporter substrate-binding protein [Chloroflexota bacterium]